MGCNGNCGACSGTCGGCARELMVTREELEFLRELGQVAFLPVVRSLGDPTPIYPEGEQREQYSLLLQCMEKKGLISLDFDRPLKGFRNAGYASFPVQGSIALTERGQKVLEILEYQGISEE